MTLLSPNPDCTNKPKLFTRFCETVRTMHYSKRTEPAYVQWIQGMKSFQIEINFNESKISFLQEMGIALQRGLSFGIRKKNRKKKGRKKYLIIGTMSIYGNLFQIMDTFWGVILRINNILCN